MGLLAPAAASGTIAVCRRFNRYLSAAQHALHLRGHWRQPSLRAWAGALNGPLEQRPPVGGGRKAEESQHADEDSLRRRVVLLGPQQQQARVLLPPALEEDVVHPFDELVAVVEDLLVLARQ